MNKREYQKVLKIARDDLERMFRQREDLERKIARQRETVISLGLLAEHDPRTSPSLYLAKNLTDACLYAVIAAKTPIDAIAIRKYVERLGFDIGSSNPLASVHSVMRRLIEQGEIRTVYPVSTTAMGGYQLRPHFWYGREAQLPKGWGAPSAKQLKDQIAESVNRVAQKSGADLTRITKMLTRRAEAYASKQVKDKRKGEK